MENLTNYELIVIWDMLDNLDGQVYCNHNLRNAQDELVTKVDNELGKREIDPYDYQTDKN